MSNRVTAWHAPDAGAHWYPIADWRWADVPVVVILDGGQRALAHEVLAIVRREARTKRLWWFQLGAWDGGGWARNEVRLDAYGRSPPGRYSPVAWRPVDLALWPHLLPEPLASTFGAIRPHAKPLDPVEPLDPHAASDGWPYPDVLLGRGIPKSREECEARVLRGFRTSAAQGRIGHGGGGGFCSDIPSEMVLIALKNEAREREREERAAGKRSTDAEAVRSGWTPTRRDLDDWDTALSWLNHVEPRACDAVELRAADPPFSFVQIAKFIGVKRNVTARALYDKAIEHAFASAQFNGGSARSVLGNRSAKQERSGA